MTVREKRLTLAAVLAVGAAFYLLNLLTPLYADDYSYLYTFIYTDEKFRITNLAQLFESQVNHYLVMNGRAVAHTLAQLLLMWGKPLFNFLNTGVFLLLGWAMQTLITGGGRFRLGYFLFSLGAVWFFTPAFGQDYLWLTASCTYHWCMVLLLLYLIPFRRACCGEGKGGALRAALFFPFGVLAGWTSENAALGMLVMAVCFMLACRLEGKPLRGWMLTGILGNLGGLALLLLAPGQSVRLENSGGAGGLSLWLSRGVKITLQAGKYLWLPGLVFAGLAVWHVLRDRREQGKVCWRRFLPTAVFLLGSLAAAYSMVVTPQFPARAWGCVVIFAALSVGDLFRGWKSALPGWGKKAAVLLLAGAVTGSFFPAVVSLSRTDAAVKEREAAVAEALTRGESALTAKPIRGDSRYNCFDEYGDLGTDHTQWPNTAIARYYGLDELHSTEEGANG